MTYIGIDPDVHGTGIVAVNSDDKIVRWLIVPSEADQRGAIAVMQALTNLASLARQFLNELPHVEKIAIENPIFRGSMMRSSYARQGHRVNPESIKLLAQIASGCYVFFRMVYPGADIRLVTPDYWKGAVPKSIHQRRLLKGLGIPFSWNDKGQNSVPIPTDGTFDGASTVDLRQLLDALGLAVFAHHDMTSARLKDME